MALTWLYILASLIGGLSIFTVVYFAYLNFKGDDPENKPYLIHFGSQYSKGYALLIMDNWEVGEKRVKIKPSPRDINYIRALKERNQVELKPLFLDKAFFLPSGISTHRQIFFGLPQRISDLPYEFRKTSMGKAFENIIMNIGKLKTTEDLYDINIKSVTDEAKKLARGEVFLTSIEVSKEQLLDREFIQKNKEPKDEKPR